MKIRRRATSLICFLSLLSFALTSSNAALPQKIDEKKTGSEAKQQEAAKTPQKITAEGVNIEFDIEPVAHYSGKAELIEGRDAVVRFRIRDAQTGAPLNGLRPAAWMDLKNPSEAPEPGQCRKKVQSFLQSSLNSRPDIDLNTYYILALNDEPTISVIDPLLGYGGSKLLTLVFLKSAGEDWALSRDNRKLFVTMPESSQVAVIDTATWRVTTNIDVGPKPNRIVIQEDQKYIWVGCDATDKNESGVTVIDSGEMKTVSRIRTGGGHHEIAFDKGYLHAFVTNRDEDTVSVIDVRNLTKTKDIKTGAQPSSLAYSSLGESIYVASEGDGAITVVGGSNQDVVARIPLAPGLKTLRFTPNGRYGIVADPKNDSVYVFDTSTNRVTNEVKVEGRPQKISFTENFAYIWAAGTEHVTMIRLDSIGKGGEMTTIDFPGGQMPPEKFPGGSIADSITPAPEGGTVLVANPADKIIYYYSEGMAAPMGNFQNYRRAPRAVMVWNRSLREVSPGVYSTSIRLAGSGNYDVAFLLDSPRVVNCFEAVVKADPFAKKIEGPPIKIQWLIADSKIPVGERVSLRFKLLDRKTDQPKDGLKDVGVFVFLAPGIWQNRQWLRSTGEGIYEITFSPPKSGVYYVFVQCPSLNVRYNQLPHIILEAKEAKLVAPQTQAH
ncbi:MAG: YncE family protein [Acidobacteriota bacterium]